MFIRKSLHDMGSYWADCSKLSHREVRLVLRSARARGSMVPEHWFVPSLVVAAIIVAFELLGTIYGANVLIESLAGSQRVFAAILVIVCALGLGPSVTYLLVQLPEAWRLRQLKKLLEDHRFVSVRHPALKALLRISGDDHDLFDRYPGAVNALLADTALCDALMRTDMSKSQKERERLYSEAYETLERYVARLYQFDKAEARRNSQAIRINRQ